MGDMLTWLVLKFNLFHLNSGTYITKHQLFATSFAWMYYYESAHRILILIMVSSNTHIYVRVLISNIFHCQIFIQQRGWVTSSHNLSYDPSPAMSLFLCCSYQFTGEERADCFASYKNLS